MHEPYESYSGFHCLLTIILLPIILLMLFVDMVRRNSINGDFILGTVIASVIFYLIFIK
jgi:hypothetical protein